MRYSYHNIDKAAFRLGEYVGYAKGVWQIRKSSRGWSAAKRDEPGYLHARTLAGISRQLEAHANS